MSESSRSVTRQVSTRDCLVCGAPLAPDDALACSAECRETWRTFALAMPAGCERSGECALPYRHDGDCDWGDDGDCE